MSNVNPNKNILVGHWHDSKIMSFLSTFHDGTMSKTERKGCGSPTKVEVSCPNTLKDYNLFMHGNDRADQMRKSFSIQIRSKKWWKPLFNFVFDSACINAYLLYRQWYQDGLDRKRFMICLCNWLCKIKENVSNHVNEGSNTSKSKPMVRHVEGLDDKMIGNHFLCKVTAYGDAKGTGKSFGNRGYCFVHAGLGQQKRCTKYCHGCQKYFHDEFYELYHLKRFLYLKNDKITSF